MLSLVLERASESIYFFLSTETFAIPSFSMSPEFPKKLDVTHLHTELHLTGIILHFSGDLLPLSAVSLQSLFVDPVDEKACWGDGASSSSGGVGLC